MSVATQIERLQGVRDQIRTKMVSLGLSANTALLQDLADDLDGIVARGDASATLSTSARSKTLSAGYYTGGTISVPSDYFPVNTTNTTATNGDVLTGKKFVNTSGTTVSGTINTASSSDITGTVSVSNPEKITLTTASTTGSSSGSANASATVAKTLYTGPTGVTNNSLGAKTISASAEVALASSVASTTSIPSTLPTGTVEVAPSTTRILYSDTSSTKGYLKSFVVSAIPTQTKNVTPTINAQTIIPDSGKFLTSVAVAAIPNQKNADNVTATVSTSISDDTINASHKTTGLSVTASSSGSVSVPLGYYSSAVNKSPSSSKSAKITPKLAGTNANGAISVTAGTSATTVTSENNYNNGFITSVTVNPTPSESKSVTPAVTAQTISPSAGKLLSSVAVGAIPNQKSASDVTATVSAEISNVTSINASQIANGVTVTASASGSTSVPLGYYSSVVSKSPSASKSTTIKPTLANTNGSIELTAGTSSFTKTSTADYSNGFITSVKINPTPSQSKAASPSTSAQTITPDSGKLLSSVAISAISTETKSITAGTSASTTSATSGKFITSVTVNPTPSQSKSITPKMADQTVSPDSGKLLSSVTVNAVPSISVTLSSGSWSSDSNTTIGKYYYNITHAGITASNNLYVMPSSASTAQSFGVYAYSQSRASGASTGTLQFRAVAKPTSNLAYTIYYLS